MVEVKKNKQKKKSYFLNVFWSGLLKRDWEDKRSFKGSCLKSSEICFLGRVEVWCVAGLLFLKAAYTVQ